MVSRSNRRLVINIEMENFDRERMKMIWRFLGLVLGYKTCDTKVVVFQLVLVLEIE